jgi:hypothetical protein
MEGPAMARRSGAYQHMAWLSFAAVLATALPSVILLAGCSENDSFETRHCAVNASPRVSENRVVTMMAVNYLYSDTTGFYIDAAPNTIAAAYEVMNGIFRNNNINLQIASLAVFARNVPSLNLEPGDPNVQEMVQVHHEYSKYIGVHWPEWSVEEDSEGRAITASKPCASESCNYLSLAGQIHNWSSNEELGRLLAHTFGYYFNLEDIAPNATNLMSELDMLGTPGPGANITFQQRETMWSAINSGRPTLESVTCDPPPVLAPRLPKISAAPGPP